MNEVEKMYENAEPNRNCNLYKHFTECPMKHTQCEDCENFVYPPFTAEKQIKLTQKLWELRPNIYPNFDLLVNYSYSEMIATFVNNLWQDLTEEERKQIRNILESEVKE